MSVFDDIEEFSTELSSFSNTLYAAILKKWEHVAESYDSERLQGLNLAQVKSRLMAIVTAHTSKLNVNIHKIKPEDLDAFSDTVLRQMVDELLDQNTNLPYSFWGRQNFLPPPASAIFASSTYETAYGATGMCLEDNGDLSVLRNGTDGNTRGVFYSVIEGAHIQTLPVLKATNVRYDPVALKPVLTSLVVYASNSTIIGKTSSSDASGITGWFLGLTNGTFSSNEHNLVAVPFSVIPDSRHAFCVVYKSTFLVFTWVGTCEWAVYQTSISSIISGNVNFTRKLGWKIKLANNTLVDSDTFKHAVNFNDLINYTGKEVSSGNHSYHSIFCETRADGTVDIRLRHRIQFGPLDGLSGHPGDIAQFDVHLTDSQIIDSSSLLSNRPTVDYTNLTISIEKKGIFRLSSPMGIHGHQYLAEYYSRSKHFCIRLNATTNGISSTIVEFDRASRSQYMQDYSGVVRSTGVSVQVNYPTSVGSGIILFCLNPNRAVLHSLHTPQLGIASCNIQTGNVLNYTGISEHTVKGFQLNTDRVKIDLPRSVFNKSVSEVNAINGTMLTHSFSLSGGDLIGDGPELENMSHSNLLNYGVASHTVSAAVKNKITSDLKNYIRQSHPLLHQLNWKLVIPSTLVNVGPFILVDFVVGDVDRKRSLYSGMLLATTSISAGAINSVSLNTATFAAGYSVHNTALGFGSTPVGMVAIRSCSDGVLVSAVSPTMGSGHSNSFTTLRSYRVVGTSITHLFGATWGSPWTVSLFNHPTLGLYLTGNSPLGMIDAGTKAIGRLYATTSSNPANVYIPSPTFLPTDRMIISSEVPDKWTVYFSDEVECMIDGVYGSISPLIYSLNPVTDFWKVYHVWLKLEGSTFKYVFERTEYDLNLSNINTDRSKSIYLGYFSTDRNGIRSIVLEKSIAIGGYRVSEWKAGKSIPVSDSFPMDLDKLNWV